MSTAAPVEELVLIVERHTPRLDWLTSILFGRVHPINCRLVERRAFHQHDRLEGSRVVNYSFEPIPGVPALPVSDLLYSTGIDDDLPLDILPLNSGDSVEDVLNLRVGTCRTDTALASGMAFDPLAAAFFWLSGWADYATIKLDPHGRPDRRTQRVFRAAGHHAPAVPAYARMVLRQAGMPADTLRPARKAVLQCTVDIDRPWEFRHKPVWRNILGGMRDLIRRDSPRLQRRIRSLFRGEDVFETLPRFLDICPPESLRMFALMGGPTPWDHPEIHRGSAYRDLLQEIVAAGGQVGLHPSYLTAHDDERLAREKKRLETWLDMEITHSRQHFFRTALPLTYRNLIRAGIRHEYTTAPLPDAGFLHGMTCPFPWYDLEAETGTELILHPTLAMDRTFLQYLRLDPEEADRLLRSRLARFVQEGGEMNLLIHNEALSGVGEWRGWREVIGSWLHLVGHPLCMSDVS